MSVLTERAQKLFFFALPLNILDDQIRPNFNPEGLVINYWEGRGYKLGKVFAPPPSRQGKIFYAPPFFFKGGRHVCAPPPSSIVKTSSTHVKTASKLVVPPPPFGMAKSSSIPTPIFVGVKLHLPHPLPFCNPPPLSP